MRRGNTTHRLICFLVSLVVLLCSLSAAGVEESNADAEISLPSANLPPSLDAAAAAGPRKNIIWYVVYGRQLANESLNQDARQTLAFTASYNQAFLANLVGMRCSSELAGNGTLLTSVEMNSNNTVLNDIHYTYVGRAFSGSSATIGGTNGTTIGPGYYKVRYENVLLECRFESNWDFDDTHFAITNALSNVLDTQWVILGDVNRDETVDTADSQLILQYSTGQTSYLNELQLRAADVNEDGVIDATDALLVNQYSTAQISTFWRNYTAPAALPTTENSDIVNGGAYTLQNVFNSNGLSYPGVTSDGVKIKQTMLSTTTGTQQFVFSYKANGEYEIRCKNNSNLVWTKSTGNELVLQTRTASPSSAQRWYVVKSTDGSFHLVNKAMTSRSLTVQGDSDTFETGADVVAIGTSTVGNRWRLYRDVSRVSTDYFDASFALRYEKANLPMTNAQGGIVWKDVVYNSHPARLIGDARSNATRVFGSLLGVSVRYSGIKPYESTADACRRARGLSLTEYYEHGSTDGHDYCLRTDGVHAHGRYPTDINYGSHSGQLIHCTDDRAQNDLFDEAHPSTNAKRFDALWTGATLYRLEGNTYKVYNRAGTTAESHQTNQFIHMTGVYDDGYFAPGLTATYIHEMAHRWGAPDHYHEVVNGRCTAGERGICSDLDCESFKSFEDSNKKHRSKACMMYSNGRWGETESTQKLFCADCLNDMKQYVNDNY